MVFPVYFAVQKDFKSLYLTVNHYRNTGLAFDNFKGFHKFAEVWFCIFIAFRHCLCRWWKWPGHFKFIDWIPNGLLNIAFASESMVLCKACSVVCNVFGLLEVAYISPSSVLCTVDWHFHLAFGSNKNGCIHYAVLVSSYNLFTVHQKKRGHGLVFNDYCVYCWLFTFLDIYKAKLKALFKGQQIDLVVYWGFNWDDGNVFVDLFTQKLIAGYHLLHPWCFS